MAYTLRKNGKYKQNITLKSDALSVTKDEKAALNRRVKVHGFDNIEDYLLSIVLSGLGYIEEKLPMYKIDCVLCNSTSDTSHEGWCPQCEEWINLG